MRQLEPVEKLLSIKGITNEILKWLSIPDVFTLNRTTRFFKTQTETYLQSYLKEWNLNTTAEIPSKDYFKLLMVALMDYQLSKPGSFDTYHVQRFKNSIKKRLPSNLLEMEQELELFLSPELLTACLFNLIAPHQLIEINKEKLKAMSHISSFKAVSSFFKLLPFPKCKELSVEQIRVFLNFLHYGKEFGLLFKKFSPSEREKILSCLQICIEDEHYYNGSLRFDRIDNFLRNIKLMDIFLKYHSFYKRKMGLLILIVTIEFYSDIDSFVANAQQCEKFIGKIGLEGVPLLFHYVPDLMKSIDESALNLLIDVNYRSFLSGKDYTDKNRDIIYKLVQIISNLPKDINIIYSMCKSYKSLFSLLVNLPDEIFNTLTPHCYKNLELKKDDDLYVKYCNMISNNGHIIEFFEKKEITLEEFLSLDGKTLYKLNTPLDIKNYIQKHRNQDQSMWRFLNFKR